MNTPVDSSLVPLIVLLSVGMSLALYVWNSLALAAVFRKMGEDAWKGWVPVLNTGTILKWGGYSPWLALLLFVPVGGFVVWVLQIVSAHRINAGFGYGTGMTVLSAVFLVVWASILGFGPARWLGPRVPPGDTGGIESAEGNRREIRPGEHGADGPPAAILIPPMPPLPAPSPSSGQPAPAPSAPVDRSSASADAASFAPPPAAAPQWTPPDTSPRPHPGVVGSRDAARPDAALEATQVHASDLAGADSSWPSEIDDVSAIHPSPFPPTAAGGRPFLAPPMTDGPGPVAVVPGHRSPPVLPPSSPSPPSPIMRVPAAGGVRAESARDDKVTPAPVSSEGPGGTDHGSADPDEFPEFSGEVSAVVGAPTAGAPRSAAAAVSAQHRESGQADARPDDWDDDDLDMTIIASRAGRVRWELVPTAGPPIALTASVVILGRRPAADSAFPGAQLIAVPDEGRTVSKTHARLEWHGEAWAVTDLASTNGVLVRTLMGDEVEVEPGGQLDAGERFFLGDEEFHLRRLAP